MSEALPETTDEYMAWLRAHEAGYTPNSEVAAQTGNTTMKLLVGPSSTGKSTVIERVIAEQPDAYGRVKSFTTRPKRTEDDPGLYLYLRHDVETLRSIADLVMQREIVQFAPHPTQEVVYGSMRSAYNKPNMMMDCLSSAVAGMQRIPFKQVQVFGVVAEPEQWWQRFDARYPEAEKPDERLKRAREAVQSTTWLLDNADSVIWVNSSEGTLGEATETVIQSKSAFDGRNYALGIAAVAGQYITIKEGIAA